MRDGDGRFIRLHAGQWGGYCKGYYILWRRAIIERDIMGFVAGRLGVAMQSEVEKGKRRLSSARTVVVCLAVISLVATLATRTFARSSNQTHTVQSSSSSPKIQHRHKDAYRWAVPLGSFPLLWSSAPSRRIAEEEEPFLSPHTDDCRYNRPPPVC